MSGKPTCQQAAWHNSECKADPDEPIAFDLASAITSLAARAQRCSAKQALSRGRLTSSLHSSSTVVRPQWQGCDMGTLQLGQLPVWQGRGQACPHCSSFWHGRAQASHAPHSSAQPAAHSMSGGKGCCFTKSSSMAWLVMSLSPGGVAGTACRAVGVCTCGASRCSFLAVCPKDAMAAQGAAVVAAGQGPATGRAAAEGLGAGAGTLLCDMSTHTAHLQRHRAWAAWDRSLSRLLCSLHCLHHVANGSTSPCW